MTNETEDTRYMLEEIESFDEYWQWRQGQEEDRRMGEVLWIKFKGNTYKVNEEFERYLWIKKHGGIYTEIDTVKKFRGDKIRTFTFVIDFTKIKKAWSYNQLPRHFGISSSEKSLCLNYERTNRGIFEYIYKKLMKTGQFEEVVMSSCYCDYIEIPIGYAIKKERIKDRRYGVRIKDQKGIYHNFPLIHFPENVNIDYKSLYPVQFDEYNDVRWRGHHTMADTIPLHCGYERPLNAFMNDNFNGPEVMKISYFTKRHNQEWIPTDQWFHRYVESDNHIQRFSFPDIEEVLFGDKPVDRLVFIRAYHQFEVVARELLDNWKSYQDSKKQHINIQNEVFGHRETFKYESPYTAYNLKRDKQWFEDHKIINEWSKNLKVLFFDITGEYEENPEWLIERMLNSNASRFERYSMIYHRFVLPGYDYVQYLPREERPYDIDIRWHSDYSLKPTQIVPYYRKVDIITHIGENLYSEEPRDPGRVFPFVSYGDPSFIYCFNNGWTHLFGYFTISVISKKSALPHVGDHRGLRDKPIKGEL